MLTLHVYANLHASSLVPAWPPAYRTSTVLILITHSFHGYTTIAMALQKQHLQRPGQSHQAEFFAMCQISAQWKRLPACQHASICIAQETSKEKS